MSLLLCAFLYCYGCSPIVWLPSLSWRDWQEECDEAFYSFNVEDIEQNLGMSGCRSHSTMVAAFW